MPTDRLPIEDLKMRHVTRAHINPSMLQKLHDRGEDMTEKQWLSSNYSVEGKGRWIRADSDRSASAFIVCSARSPGRMNLQEDMCII